jgi:hypothetical protein
MSHTRKMRKRHPYKRLRHALSLRFQTAPHGQACEICGMALRRKPYIADVYTVLCRVCFVKESSMPTCTATDLTAFCASCPAAEEVTAALSPLGFTLAFQMRADTARAYTDLPPLPAQYHYEGPHGASVIYLAGKDMPCLGDEDERDWGAFPPHASRFWLYAGADAGAHEQTAQVLTSAWALTWLPLDAVPVEQQPSLDRVA